MSGVSRVYDDGGTPVHALRGVDLDVNGGEFVSLAGPSGSGKSTLLHIIGGLDQSTEGRVSIDGVDIDQLDANQLTDMRLTKIGFVFQAYNLVPVLSARENVEFLLQLQGVGARDRRGRALEALDSLGLAELADRRPGEMSGGQQQRVAIARALVTDPLLVLADEPSANLDTNTTKDLCELMQRINKERGTTIVAATHDPLVMSYTSRRVELRDGAIERISTPG